MYSLPPDSLNVFVRTAVKSAASGNTGYCQVGAFIEKIKPVIIEEKWSRQDNFDLLKDLGDVYSHA